MIIAMAMVMTGFGSIGAMPVSADAADGENGGLLWYFKDTEGTSMQGVSAPVVDGDYVYMASGKVLYKIDAVTGELAGKASLSGSIGYNKLAPTVAEISNEKKILVPLNGKPKSTEIQLDIVDLSSMELEKTIPFSGNNISLQALTPATYDSSDNSVYLGSWSSNYGGSYVKISLDNDTAELIQSNDNGFYWAGACVDGDYVVFGSNSNGTGYTPETGNAVLYAYDKSKNPDDENAVLETTLEGSGSICSTVVSYNGKYYFTSKARKLYEASIVEGVLYAEVKTDLSGTSTCAPVIDGEWAYVGEAEGKSGYIEKINLETGQLAQQYSVPGDVKFLTLSGDKIYCTYNETPGGIYAISISSGVGSNYFIPHSSMQNYCISSIAQGQDGTLYFTNDSNNLMAVRDADELITAAWDGADSSGKISAKAYTGSAVEPSVTVQYDGASLSVGDDGYRITYSNNIYPGIATAVIKGTGSYKGTHVLDFGIKSPAVAAQKTVTAQLYGYDDVQVKWSTQSVSGATVYYKVEYKKSGGSWTTLSSGTTASSIKKADLTGGAGYYFRVTPYVKVNGTTYYGISKTSSIIYTLKKLSTPSIKKSSSKYIKISWKNIQGESGYQIGRSKYKNKNFSVIKTVSYKYSSYKLKTTRNKTYYYKIRAYKTVNGQKVYGPWSSVKSYKLK